MDAGLTGSRLDLPRRLTIDRNSDFPATACSVDPEAHMKLAGLSVVGTREFRNHHEIATSRCEMMCCWYFLPVRF
jgi:hypothetical protein